jgi:hypothetical protein
MGQKAYIDIGLLAHVRKSISCYDTDRDKKNELYGGNGMKTLKALFCIGVFYFSSLGLAFSQTTGIYDSLTNGETIGNIPDTTNTSSIPAKTLYFLEQDDAINAAQRYVDFFTRNDIPYTMQMHSDTVYHSPDKKTGFPFIALEIVAPPSPNLHTKLLIDRLAARLTGLPDFEFESLSTAQTIARKISENWNEEKLGATFLSVSIVPMVKRGPEFAPDFYVWGLVLDYEGNRELDMEFTVSGYKPIFALSEKDAERLINCDERECNKKPERCFFLLKHVFGQNTTLFGSPSYGYAGIAVELPKK